MTASGTSAAARPAPLQRGSLEGRKKSKPFRIFDFLWRRVPLILGLGIPAFLVLSVVLAPFASGIYKVDGSLLISPMKEPSISGKDRDVIQGDIGVFQRTLVLRLMTRDVMQAAIESLSEADRPKFLAHISDINRAVYRLMSRVKAKEVERTYLIQVSMEDSDPHGLDAILSAVLESLIKKLEEEQARQYVSRLSYLKGEREKIAQRAREERERILKLAGTLENKSFLHDSYTAHLGKVETIQKLYLEAEAERIQKAADLAEAEKNRTNLVKLSITPFAEEKVMDNFGINQIERWTYEKSQDLRSSIDGLTADNPDRKYVEARMDSMNDYMAKYKQRVNESTVKNMDEKREFDLETAVVKARSALDAAEQASARLLDDFRSANEQASRISEAIFEAKDMTYGLDQLRDRLASINTRIDDTELEAKSPLPVRINQLPAPPNAPASSNASKLMMLAFAASFGVSAGACLLFDFFDGRVRCREELGAAVGGPGAEPVPATVSAGEDPAFAGILKRQPDHPAALALRDLAVRVVTEHERSGSALVSLVGAGPRCGNSTIALNVARAISEYGFRVLLAELPTVSPGLAAAAGLTSDKVPPSAWGNKESDPASAVELIPWTNGISEDQVRSSLETFLSSARGAYDIVLLDLVALNRSDLAHEAALKSDVVIVTARQDHTQFSAVRESVDWVVAGGISAVTVVLNFAMPDPVQVRAFALLATGKAAVSRLHSVAENRIAGYRTQLAERLKARRKK